MPWTICDKNVQTCTKHAFSMSMMTECKQKCFSSDAYFSHFECNDFKIILHIHLTFGHLWSYYDIWQSIMQYHCNIKFISVCTSVSNIPVLVFTKNRWAPLIALFSARSIFPVHLNSFVRDFYACNHANPLSADAWHVDLLNATC